jgi:hypothetical protein
LQAEAAALLARARADLGYDLAGFAPSDLLLDNIAELRGAEDARALLAEIGEGPI